MRYPAGIGLRNFDAVDHPDSMNGYELILALTEDSVNRSLQNIFNFFYSRGHRKAYRVAIPAHDFEATIDPPQIGFAGTGSRNSVWFYIRLDKVRFKGSTYSGWSFAYKMPLRSDQLDERLIRENQAITEEVRTTLLSQARDRTSVVRNIVLDFERCGTGAFDGERSKHAGATGESLKAIGLHKAFQDYFATLRGCENPYTLAFVEKHQGITQTQQPTFVPGKSSYVVQADGGGPQGGCLNLLMMQQGHENLPDPAKHAVFTHSWVQGSSGDGRFVIGWRIFLRDWLLPRLKESFSILNPRQAGYLKHGAKAEWGTHSYSHQEEEEWKGWDKFVWETTELAQCWFVTSTTEDRDKTTKAVVSIDGYWEALIVVERKALGGGLWWAQRHQRLPGKIEITAGSDGRLAFQAILEKMPGTGTGYTETSLADIFVRLGGNNLNDQLANVAGGALDRVRNTFAKAETDLSKQLSSSFLLPGGERFFFKNARFDSDQNLVFDVTFKAIN